MKEPRDDVAHEVLGAEADREAGDAGAGQDRHDVDRQLAQQHQDRDEPDRTVTRLRQDAAQRARAALPLEIGLPVAPRQLCCRCSIARFAARITT